MKHNIGLIFSKKDFKYNVDSFGKENNLIFITGLVGAGKSTLSEYYSDKKGAIILHQDWLAWSEVYTDKLSNKILKMFYQKYPRAEEIAKNNLWHIKDGIAPEERKYLREKFNSLLIEYANNNKDKLFVIEGIDIYKTVSVDIIRENCFISKGTGVLKCFIRRYRRDKTVDNQKDFKAKYTYLTKVLNESKKFYFEDRKNLNILINEILN